MTLPGENIFSGLAKAGPQGYTQRVFNTLILFLMTAVAQADIYVWTDQKGVTHYSARPPKDASARKKARIIKSAANPSPPPAASPSPSAAAGTVGSPRPPKAKPSPRVELYTTSWCPVCRQARDYLTSRGATYQEYDIEADAQALARFQGYGGRGVPLALIDGHPVSGFSPEVYDQMMRPSR